MSDIKEIRQHIRKIAGDDSVGIVIGKVVSVGDDTCAIKADGLEIPNVKLKSSVGGEHYLIQFPKVGTQATCISLDGTFANLKLLSCDEVAKVEYKQDGLEVLADSTDGKVKLKNANVSLKDIMDDLANTLLNLKVYTPTGPSGTPLPDSIASINQFSQKINQILK